MTDDPPAHDDAARAGANDPAAVWMAAEAFTGFMTDAFAVEVCRAVAEQAAKGVTGLHDPTRLPGGVRHQRCRQDNTSRRAHGTQES